MNPSLNPYEQLEPQTLLSTGVLDSGDPSNPSFSVVILPENRRNLVGFRVFNFLTILKPFETIDLF